MMMRSLPRYTVVLLFVYAGAAQAADVGRVLLAAGDAYAVRGGQTVKLVYGAMIQDRDVLRTGQAGNLQVRFSDEGIVSLKENSELRIDNYQFSGKEDGSERGFFSLLKGGLRVITGLIGRNVNANYRLSTTTATIGIRGTDYAATLCQGDCRNSDGSQARDGLYGRTLGMSHGSNRIEVSNERDSKTFGINENFYVADAKSVVEPLLVAPDFVSNRLEGRKQSDGKSAGGSSGTEQATTGGAAAESRPSSTPEPLPQLQFVVTQSLGPQGTPVVVSSVPSIAIVGSFADLISIDPNDGGAFLAPANLITDPAGASATLSATQILIGLSVPPGSDAEPGGSSNTVTASTTVGSVIDETTPNSLNAHWGRWTSGTFIDSSTTTITTNNQFHYLYGPLTPPEVIAGKTGTFGMSMVAGTTPTNQLGQTGTFSTSLTVNFTAQTATFGASSFTFPSDSWTFSGGTTPFQIVPGKGVYIDQVTAGTCSGSTCLTSTPATLGKTGIFMGPAGDHLGVSFSAKTDSGPVANAQTAKIFSCAPSC